MITLLKLGGSLITDKAVTHTARHDVLARLGREIAAYRENTSAPLIIGHGSGSFGHVPAKKYGTRKGVRTAEEWAGFAEVHAEAMDLNHIVTDTLRSAGLPCLSFVPMDELVPGREGFERLFFAMEQGLIPIVFGDTVFDAEKGGTIYSTEDLFTRICRMYPGPNRILLAGLETCVWADFPRNTRRIETIGAEENLDCIGASAFTDVTGGMAEKVRLMQQMIREGTIAEARIFSGMTEGTLTKELSGENTGTLIRGR